MLSFTRLMLMYCMNINHQHCTCEQISRPANYSICRFVPTSCCVQSELLMTSLTRETCWWTLRPIHRATQNSVTTISRRRSVHFQWRGSRRALPTSRVSLPRRRPSAQQVLAVKRSQWSATHSAFRRTCRYRSLSTASVHTQPSTQPDSQNLPTHRRCMSVCLSVCLPVCPVSPFNSRTGKAQEPKFGRMEAHHTGNQ